jgi:hypothetical protein
VRGLCAQFPDEYFRKIDEQRGYPAEFVEALTKAGWLAGLEPARLAVSGRQLVLEAGLEDRWLLSDLPPQEAAAAAEALAAARQQAGPSRARQGEPAFAHPSGRAEPEARSRRRATPPLH